MLWDCLVDPSLQALADTVISNGSLIPVEYSTLSAKIKSIKKQFQKHFIFEAYSNPIKYKLYQGHEHVLVITSIFSNTQ